MSSASRTAAEAIDRLLDFNRPTIAQLELIIEVAIAQWKWEEDRRLPKRRRRSA